MNDKDKMYILNDILCEVKPLYLRQRVGARFIEFVDNKIPKGSVVLTQEEWANLHEDYAKALYEKNKQARKQAIKDFIQAIKKDANITHYDDEVTTFAYVDIDDIYHIAIDKFGVEI